MADTRRVNYTFYARGLRARPRTSVLYITLCYTLIDYLMSALQISKHMLAIMYVILFATQYCYVLVLRGKYSYYYGQCIHCISTYEYNSTNTQSYSITYQ